MWGRELPGGGGLPAGAAFAALTLGFLGGDEQKLYREIPVAVARFGKHLQFDRMVQLRWPVS